MAVIERDHALVDQERHRVVRHQPVVLEDDRHGLRLGADNVHWFSELVGTLSLSSGAHSRDPLALPTLQDCSSENRSYWILNFITSSLNLSPWPGFSGAVIMPSLIAGGSTQRSSSRPMFSHQIPFGIEASRCTFNSGNRCGAMVTPQVSASVAILRRSVMPPRIGSGCRIGRQGLRKKGLRS